MRRTAVAVLIALVCSLVHGRDRLARTRENAWEDFELYKVPEQDREPLWQPLRGSRNGYQESKFKLGQLPTGLARPTQEPWRGPLVPTDWGRSVWIYVRGL